MSQALIDSVQPNLLGLPLATEFSLPNCSPLSAQWRVLHAQIPALLSQPSYVPKFVVPNPNDAGALVVYGALHACCGDSNRQAVLLKPGADAMGFQSIAVSSGLFHGAAIRPNQEHPLLVTWDKLQLRFSTLDGTDQSLGSVGCKGITSVCFRPNSGHYLVARTSQNGIQAFRLLDISKPVDSTQQPKWPDGFRVEVLGRAQNRQPGTTGALSYDAKGEFLYGVEVGQCTVVDVTGRTLLTHSYGVLPDGEEPFLVACQSDRTKPSRAAFAGFGRYAHFIAGPSGRWSKTPIAPRGQEIGATGLAWLDSDYCLGWLGGRLFAFAAAAPGENSDEPDFLSTWTPPHETKIMSVQVLRETRQIIVFTAPIPSDQLQRPD